MTEKERPLPCEQSVPLIHNDFAASYKAEERDLSSVCAPDVHGARFIGTKEPSVTAPPPSYGEGLEAAIRAAKLALFVIRKQGIMPNASWERGFEADLAIAEKALASLPSPPASPKGDGE